jgi:hypothetical protein
MRNGFAATILLHPGTYPPNSERREKDDDPMCLPQKTYRPNPQYRKSRKTMEEVMRLVAKLCAAGIVCAMAGSCAGVATANPWQFGKNKLPRLSSKPQNIAVEHIHITRNWGLAARKRHNR